MLRIRKNRLTQVSIRTNDDHGRPCYATHLVDAPDERYKFEKGGTGKPLGELLPTMREMRREDLRREAGRG